MSACQPRDRGAASVEHVGMVVVAALLVVTVGGFVSAGSTALGQRVSCALASISVPGAACTAAAPAYAGPAGVGGGPAGVGGGPVGDSGPDGGDGKSRGEGTSRADAGRDAGRDREDRGRGDETQPKDGTPGPAPQPGGLGAPVPGTSVPAPPPPAWEPVDPGAGEHGSQSAGVGDRAKEAAVELAAHAFSSVWPDAGRNLLHFLGNSGEPLEQDVDRMLADLPEFRDAVTATQDDVAALAVQRAKASGAPGPLTFPVSTRWTGFGYNPPYDDDNWFYALGGWQFSLTGQVTVWPPATPGGEWQYTVTTVTEMKDQYNWDGGKQVTIAGRTVTDAELAELHRKGLAQEFQAHGRSAPADRQGSLP